MAIRHYSGNSTATTITAGINASATAVTVAALPGFPTQFPYTAVIDRGTASEEVVTVSNASGLNLTVVRGVDGTAKSHNSGATFAHGVSAVDFNEINNSISSISLAAAASGDVIMSLMNAY